MTNKLPYTYVVLRYVHDLSTAEFVNVGVVLTCPKRKFFDAQLRHTHRRLSSIFPDLDASAFRATMRAIENAIKNVGAAQEADDLFSENCDALSLAKKVLPADDSSLQWSPMGSGIASDPRLQLDRLFERLVSGYDGKNDHKRSDADVWRPVRDRLIEARLGSKLHEKTIKSDVDQINFEHAWKNGAWHCYQPLSFDLADAEGIKRKARQWMGHLTAVSDATEPFKPYFIVGAPSDGKLMKAYGDALLILEKSPVAPEIFTESQIDELVTQIEIEVSAHDRAT